MFSVCAVGSSFFWRDAQHNPSRGSGANVGMYGVGEAAIPRAHESRSSIPRPPNGGGACSVTVTVIVARGRGRGCGRWAHLCLPACLPAMPWQVWPGLPGGPRLGACCLHACMAAVYCTCSAEVAHCSAGAERQGKISREPVWYGTVVAVQSVPRVMLISLPGSTPTATVPRLVGGG